MAAVAAMHLRTSDHNAGCNHIFYIVHSLQKCTNCSTNRQTWLAADDPTTTNINSVRGAEIISDATLFTRMMNFYCLTCRFRANDCIRHSDARWDVFLNS